MALYQFEQVGRIPYLEYVFHEDGQVRIPHEIGKALLANRASFLPDHSVHAVGAHYVVVRCGQAVPEIQMHYVFAIDDEAIEDEIEGHTIGLVRAVSLHAKILDQFAIEYVFYLHVLELDRIVQGAFRVLRVEHVYLPDFVVSVDNVEIRLAVLLCSLN